MILERYFSPWRSLYLEFALKYKVKQSKNGKFLCHYKPAQSILKRKFPSIHKPFEYKPLKRVFEKYKPRGLIFGILQ